MPLNDYFCADCRSVTTLLKYSWSEASGSTCKSCGGSRLEKLISGFAIRRSWGDSLNWVPGKDSLTDFDDDNSQSVDRYMGQIKREMGGQVTPDFEQMRKETSSDS